MFTATGGDTWHKDRTVDLTGKAGVADNPEFRFRVVATFKPNTTGYERSSGRGNYGDGELKNAVWRFDMVRVGENALPESTVDRGWGEWEQFAEGPGAG